MILGDTENCPLPKAPQHLTDEEIATIASKYVDMEDVAKLLVEIELLKNELAEMVDNFDTERSDLEASLYRINRERMQAVNRARDEYAQAADERRHLQYRIQDLERKHR